MTSTCLTHSNGRNTDSGAGRLVPTCALLPSAPANSEISANKKSMHNKGVHLTTRLHAVSTFKC